MVIFSTVTHIRIDYFFIPEDLERVLFPVFQCEFSHKVHKPNSKPFIETTCFQVWIDLDNMINEDEIMEGMAKAIENSFVVCILYSKSYKDSPNTRAGKFTESSKQSAYYFILSVTHCFEGVELTLRV